MKQVSISKWALVLNVKSQTGYSLQRTHILENNLDLIRRLWIEKTVKNDE